MGSESMFTEKLFQKDVYLRHFSAKVIEISIINNAPCAVLDRTAFFPEGGGQFCDIGQIGDADVIYVFEKDGKIFHKIAPGQSLTPGTVYDCSIDWDRRFENMQRHLGEHIFTGIFYREYGGTNRGFHMGDSYMTIDISLEEEATVSEITYEMAEKAERMANEVIWDDVPVITHRYSSYDEAKDLPMRKKLTIDEDISIVSIGSKDSIWGSVACCGTHPDTTGQVGLIKLYKVEPNKGMWRIYFDAGRKALETVIEKQKILTTISERFSAGDGDVLEKIEVHEAKGQAIRDNFLKLKRKLAGGKAETINSEMDGHVHTYSFDGFTADDYRHIAKLLNLNGLVLFADRETNTVLLFSGGTPDCGKLVKENAPKFGGRGGGRADNAQAGFTEGKSMNLFIEAIEKAGDI